MSKSLRVLQVLEVVKALGRASPRDIQYKVASRMAVDAEDPNFKRNIYRDLKELADQGKLEVFCFSPDGEAVDVESADSHKNIRVEYSVSSGDNEDQISGWKTLASCGLQFLATKKVRSLWKAQEIKSPYELKGFFSVVIRLLNGEVLALQTPLDQLPAKLIFGRQGDMDETQILADLTEREGLRAGFVMCSDTSVSRYSAKERLGHCKITVDSSQRIKVADLKSASGTRLSFLDQDSIPKLWIAKSDVKTSPFLGGALETGLMGTIQTVENEMAAESPFAIKIGSTTLFIVISK